jgi:hypothetical protein
VAEDAKLREEAFPVEKQSLVESRGEYLLSKNGCEGLWNFNWRRVRAVETNGGDSDNGRGCTKKEGGQCNSEAVSDQ